MNVNIVNGALRKLETDEKVILINDSLGDKQVDGKALTDVLLDVIHMAFTSGFELAIKSIMSSDVKKSIE